MLGANGAGKTTTFRMILGLLDPTSGSVTWDGRPLSYKRTSLIGYLPEERGLYPKLTVKEQIIYLMRLKGMKKSVSSQLCRSGLKRSKYRNMRTKKLKSFPKEISRKSSLLQQSYINLSF